MKRLQITYDVLDRLGFGEYHDDNGYSGGRALHLGDEISMWIVEVLPQDDVYEGYANMMKDTEPLYQPHYFYYCSSYDHRKDINYSADLDYIEDLYECVKKMYPEYIDSFLNRCKKANMMPYINECKQLKTNIMRPIAGKILVKPQEIEMITKSGIVLIEEQPSEIMQGEVIAVGKPKNNEEMEVQVGDIIMYGKYGGTEINYEGENYLIMNQSAIFLIK